MTMLRSGGWILLVWLAAPAAAQDVGPFDQLVGLVEPGDGVRVTFSGGRERRARVVAVTPETLSVVTHGQHLDLGEEDVWFIHRQVRDPTRKRCLGRVRVRRGRRGVVSLWLLLWRLGLVYPTAPGQGLRAHRQLLRGGGRLARRRLGRSDRERGRTLAADPQPRLERDAAADPRPPRRRRLAQLLNLVHPTGTRGSRSVGGEGRIPEPGGRRARRRAGGAPRSTPGVRGERGLGEAAGRRADHPRVVDIPSSTPLQRPPPRLVPANLRSPARRSPGASRSSRP